jgi:hypothetical protein
MRNYMASRTRIDIFRLEDDKFTINLWPLIKITFKNLVSYIYIRFNIRGLFLRPAGFEPT